MKRAVLFVPLLACSSAPQEPTVHVVVRSAVGSEISLAQSQVDPPSALVTMKRADDQLDLELRAGSGRVSVKTPGACPLEIDVASAPARLTVKPWLSVAGGDLAQVGFDAPFSVTLTPGCREALTGKVEWQQTAGEPVTLAVENNGFVVRGRTRPLDAPVPWGIVPLSPRTRGEIELTARSGEHALKVRVAAAARASGLPSLALSQRVLLGGAGWRVTAPAKDGKAQITAAGALSAFQPDARGRWVLSDAEGRELSLVVGTHSDTLLDCGRSDCHSGAAEAAKPTRMTHVFERGLRGQIPRYDVACALPCHTAGEPGLPDGGFTQVARELGLSGHFATGPDAWNHLPRPLRRLGGVTCTACHGPGAIPEPAARWAVLRTDVCATCHDAPPRYGHVQAWNATRMARADRDERARRTEGCRGCHTTAGFLAKIGVRKDSGPPSPDLQLGIGCAACHAPHGEHQDRALLRARPAGKLPDSATVSRVCVECHTAPTALLFDHAAPGAHAAVPKGCVGCHAGEAGRGKNHGFQVDRVSCSRGCHADGVPQPDGSLGKRLDAALGKLGVKLAPGQPLHARELARVADPKRRAAWELLQLLAGDRAAASHDAKRARAVMTEAEALLGIK